MRILVLAALSAIFSTSAMAQYGDVVEPRYNRSGDAVCPSNYVIRGGACVSINAGRRNSDDRRGGYGDRRRGYDDGRYGRGRDRGGDVIEPQINRRGEQQCPSNYVIRRGVCVSLY